MMGLGGDEDKMENGSGGGGFFESFKVKVPRSNWQGSRDAARVESQAEADRLMDTVWGWSLAEGAWLRGWNPGLGDLHSMRSG